MSWTLVASGRGVDSVTINSTGANFLIASFTGYFPSASGWDNKGNTWIKLSEHIVSTYRVTLAYCINPTTVGAGHTLTDPLAGGQDADIHFYAFTAPGTVTYQGETGADDNFNGGNSTKSAGYAGSMSVTPLSNDALIIAAAANYPGTSATTSAYGVDSGFTLGLSRGVTAGEYGGASAYLNQATAAAVDPTISWTTSGGGVTRWVSAIAVFTVSGGASTTRGMPFGTRGTAFNGGRTFLGNIRRLASGVLAPDNRLITGRDDPRWSLAT
jgi:hypothetical protein